MANIHPTAIVDPKVELGADVEVGPFCIIGPDVKIGARTRLVANVYIERLTEIGDDCTVWPYASLGAPPQDTSYKGEPTRVVIGNNNTFREHATVHRGTARARSVTRVGNNGLFMASTHIAHDTIVGDNVIMAQSAAIAGHVQISDWVILSGLVGVVQHCRIGRHAFVGASALMTADLIPYGTAIGNHAHLAGLNTVGLKRRGFSRDEIHDLRSAYRLLFAEEGTFQERLDDAAELYAGNPHVMEILAFIRADSNRALCMPGD